MDKRTALIVLIKNTSLLTKENKIKIINGIDKMIEEEKEKLGTFLAHAIKYEIEHNDEIKAKLKNIVAVLDALMDKIKKNK